MNERRRAMKLLARRVEKLRAEGKVIEVNDLYQTEFNYTIRPSGAHVTTGGWWRAKLVINGKRARWFLNGQGRWRKA